MGTRLSLWAARGVCLFDIEFYKLFILNINPLSVTSFTNILSHSRGCLFVLLMVSFVIQKLLSLIRSHLLIFAFISFALRKLSNKIFL